MKTLRWISLAATSAALLAAPLALAQYDDGPDELPQAQAEGPGSADFQTFYQALAPYGTWLYTPNRGWIWTPNGMSQAFRPYSDGEWAWTAYGWTWNGSDPWSWATDHYGRWTFMPDLGWSWVPGYTWGPAWVSWRFGASYVGWSPLEPGMDYGGDGDDDDDPVSYDQWCFVPYGGFYGMPVGSYLLGPSYVANVWGDTQPAGIWGEGGATYVGPSRGFVERRVGHPVVPVSIRPVGSPGQCGRGGRGQVNVFAPSFHRRRSPFLGRDGRIASVVPPDQRVGVGHLVPPSVMRAGPRSAGVRLAGAFSGSERPMSPTARSSSWQPRAAQPPPADFGDVNLRGRDHGATSSPSLGGFGARSSSDYGVSVYHEPPVSRATPPTYREPHPSYGARASVAGGDQPSLSRPSFGGDRPTFGGGFQPSNAGGYHPSYGGGFRPSNAGGYHPSYGGGFHPSNAGGYHPSFGGGFHPSSTYHPSSFHPSFGGGYHPSFDRR
ncbi:MAG: DUF6600 domain-containing protein [Deltaproteobacteria bacterium]